MLITLKVEETVENKTGDRITIVHSIEKERQKRGKHRTWHLLLDCWNPDAECWIYVASWPKSGEHRGPIQPSLEEIRNWLHRYKLDKLAGEVQRTLDLIDRLSLQ